MGKAMDNTNSYIGMGRKSCKRAADNGRSSRFIIRVQRGVSTCSPPIDIIQLINKTAPFLSTCIIISFRVEFEGQFEVGWHTHTRRQKFSSRYRRDRNLSSKYRVFLYKSIPVGRSCVRKRVTWTKSWGLARVLVCVMTNRLQWFRSLRFRAHIYVSYKRRYNVTNSASLPVKANYRGFSGISRPAEEPSTRQLISSWKSFVCIYCRGLIQ